MYQTHENAIPAFWRIEELFLYYKTLIEYGRDVGLNNEEKRTFRRKREQLMDFKLPDKFHFYRQLKDPGEKRLYREFLVQINSDPNLS